MLYTKILTIIISTLLLSCASEFEIEEPGTEAFDLSGIYRSSKAESDVDIDFAIRNLEGRRHQIQIELIRFDTQLTREEKRHLNDLNLSKDAIWKTFFYSPLILKNHGYSVVSNGFLGVNNILRDDGQSNKFHLCSDIHRVKDYLLGYCLRGDFNRESYYIKGELSLYIHKPPYLDETESFHPRLIHLPYQTDPGINYARVFLGQWQIKASDVPSKRMKLTDFDTIELVQKKGKELHLVFKDTATITVNYRDYTFLEEESLNEVSEFRQKVPVLRAIFLHKFRDKEMRVIFFAQIWSLEKLTAHWIFENDQGEMEHAASAVYAKEN